MAKVNDNAKGDALEALMNGQLGISDISGERSAILGLQIASILAKRQHLSDLQLLAYLMANQSGGGAIPQRPSGPALNALTQLMLSQYGFDPRNPNQSSSKTVSLPPIVKSSGQQTTKIENNTTYNNKTTNEIKIIQPLIPISLPLIPVNSGNDKLLKNWLNNQFILQLHDIELEKKEYYRRDAALQKMTEKMMRKIEEASKRFAENMNPERIAKATGDQMKMVLMIVAANIIAAGFGPLMNIVGKIPTSISEAIDIIWNRIKEEKEDRAKAIEQVYKDNGVNNLGEAISKNFDNVTKSIKDWAAKFGIDDTGWSGVIKRTIGGALGGIGEALMNGLKSFTSGASSGPSMIGQLLHAAVGGTGSLAKYNASKIEGTGTAQLLEGNEEHFTSNGDIKEDATALLAVSKTAEDAVGAKLTVNDDGTTTASVDVGATVSSINKLSKSTTNINYKDEKGNIITLKGTVVTARYLRAMIGPEGIKYLIGDGKNGDIILLYSSNDGLRHCSTGDKIISKLALNDAIMSPGLIDWVTGDAVNNLIDTNRLDNIISKGEYAKNDFLLYKDSDHPNEVFLISEKGWTKIKDYFGGTEGNTGDLELNEKVTLNIEDLAKKAVVYRANFEENGRNQYLNEVVAKSNLGLKAVYKDGDGKYTDKYLLGGVFGMQKEAEKHEARVEELNTQWHNSDVGRFIDNTLDWIESAGSEMGWRAWEAALNKTLSSVTYESARDSIQKVYDYLTDKVGLSREGAIGVISNLYAESKLQPSANNRNIAKGILQWTKTGNRALNALKNMNEYCKEHGLPEQDDITKHSLDAQLYALHLDIVSRPKLLKYLLSAHTVAEGTDYAFRGLVWGGPAGFASISLIEDEGRGDGGYRGMMFGKGNGRAYHALKIEHLLEQEKPQDTAQYEKDKETIQLSSPYSYASVSKQARNNLMGTYFPLDNYETSMEASINKTSQLQYNRDWSEMKRNYPEYFTSPTPLVPEVPLTNIQTPKVGLDGLVAPGYNVNQPTYNNNYTYNTYNYGSSYLSGVKTEKK